MLTRNKVIAVRDPRGFRPLCLASLTADGSWPPRPARSIWWARICPGCQPGEIIVIDETGLHSLTPFPEIKPAHCIFELIYFARPDSQIFGQNVYLCRKRLGHSLAREYRPDADLVMPFPDSGNYAALGYAEESGIPFEMGMIRNHYVGPHVHPADTGHAGFRRTRQAQPRTAPADRKKGRDRGGFHHPRHDEPQPRPEPA